MKKIIKVVLLFLIILVIGYFLLNNYLLPYKAKDLITDKLSESLKRDVKIEKLTYSLKDGIVLNNFVVSSKETNADQPFLSSNKVSFNVLI